jgi:hypothetical protein
MRCSNYNDDCYDPEWCQQGGPCEAAIAAFNKRNQGRNIVNDEQKQVALALETWWQDKTAADIEAVVPKAVEYSAIDLIEYGRTLALVMGIKHAVSDEEATEIGIWGYLVGKVARWTGAIKEGRRVSDDTIHDIKIYATMAERTRDVGGWPFGPKEDMPLITDGGLKR